MTAVTPDSNAYLEQIRFRIQTAQKAFHAAVRTLKGSQAAKGALRSGATIKLALNLLAEEFDQLSEQTIAYLGVTLSRTSLDRAELLSLTAGELLQSKAAFKAMTDPDQLRSFAPSKGIDKVIEDAFSEVDQRLTLRLKEFSFGLGDHPPASAKSEALAVTNNTIHIETNMGNIQQSTQNSSQTMAITLNARTINAALDRFELALAGLPDDDRARMMPDVVYLRAQASKPALTESVIREVGRSLRGVAEGVAGNLATPQFVAACTVLWTALGIG